MAFGRSKVVSDEKPVNSVNDAIEGAIALEEAVKEAMPKPVSLVKADRPVNKPKVKKKPMPSHTKFWCEIRGTKEGWRFDIRSNLPEVEDYDHVSYIMSSFGSSQTLVKMPTKPAPLESYGECTLNIKEFESYKFTNGAVRKANDALARYIAKDFLTKFEKSYKRVKSPVLTVYSTDKLNLEKPEVVWVQDGYPAYHNSSDCAELGDLYDNKEKISFSQAVEDGFRPCGEC